MRNYLSTPFVFTRPQAQLRELEPLQEYGDICRRLHVTFPSDMPTRLAEQIVCSDEKGLLQRIDYVGYVASGVAAHTDTTIPGSRPPVFDASARCSPQTGWTWTIASNRRPDPDFQYSGLLTT
jgi:hypothetical protein